MVKKQPKKSSETSNPLRLIYIIAMAVAAVVVLGVAVWLYGNQRFRSVDGEPVWVYLPGGCDSKAAGDSLCSALGDGFGSRVARLWGWMGDRDDVRPGAYQVTDGMAAWRVARNVSNGRQTPIKLTFNNVRTVSDLAERLAKKMAFNPADFTAACDTILAKAGFSKAQQPAAFIPDTYEFYWTDSASKVVESLLDYRNRYWTESRRSKAKSLSLTPIDVATLASIVEGETYKSDERPRVARLYLNRLKINMKLQADPTVKFAVGDPSIRRITGKHLAVESPYNTYRYKGLPPGPINIPERSTLDAVLDAPEHNFIYMCAKEDFSGYHNFATDYATHMANARAYQAELNRRNIK